MPSRLLIVDDDPTLLMALPDTIRLHLRDSVIETATSGHAALEQIKAVDYDAIVTDIKMPGMDGLSLMQEIQKIRPSTPTLLITGHGEHDLAIKSLDSGAYAFLQKPLDRAFFLAWLKRAIELRQLIRALEDSEARFRILADAAFEAIALTENSRVVDVNQAFLSLFGYEREEAIGMAPSEFHPPQFAEIASRMNLSGAETRYEAMCLTKHGVRFQAEIRGRAVPYQGRTVRVTALHPLASITQDSQITIGPPSQSD
jgi:PAS domain S-box-containing protein